MRFQADRSSWDLPPGKAAAILAFLALRPGVWQSREAVTAALWPETEEEEARSRMRQRLAVLRRMLSEMSPAIAKTLECNRAGLRLNLPPEAVDAAHFGVISREVQAAPRGEHRRNLVSLALAIYRGELFPGLDGEWVEYPRRILAGVYEALCGELAHTLRETGNLEGAMEAALRQVEANPLNEEAHLVIMGIHLDAGRPEMALAQYALAEQALRVEMEQEPSPELMEARSAALEASRRPAGVLDRESDTPPLGGAVPQMSRYYIPRETDTRFSGAIRRGDSVVLVRGPRHAGKSSLLARARAIAVEEGIRSASTSLERIAPEQFASADAFYRAAARSLADQAAVAADIRREWDSERSSNDNFERFLRIHLLTPEQGRLVWVLDDVDRLFDTPFYSQVFGLMRSWHNDRAYDQSGPWSRLTLCIGYSTDVHLFIRDVNQSPFNVGTRLELEDFTREQCLQLNERYGSPLSSPGDVARLHAFLGGIPSLTQRALNYLAGHEPDMDQFEAEALHEGGLYQDELLRVDDVLSKSREFAEAAAAALNGKPCPSMDSLRRLRSAGILRGETPGDARFRCRLYEIHLRRASR